MKQSGIKILVLIMAMAVSAPLYAKKLVYVGPDNKNPKVIKRYNRYNHGYDIMPDESIGYTAVFGVRTNSVMSTDDVEVNVVKKWVRDAVINDRNNRFYFVEIKNKCDDTIYIDKGYCFRIYNNGSRHRYFDLNKKHADPTQRIIAIPPHSKRNLSDYKVELIDKGKYKEMKVIDYPEEFNWDPKSAGVYKGRLRQNEVITFSEDSAPYYRSFLISYSKDENFSEYSYLTINCYMRQLIGCFLPEHFLESSNAFVRYGDDQYNIMNSEWVRDIP